MREYIRKYRATPRGKATKKNSDAAYYQAKKAMKAGARAMRQGDEAKNAENMAQCLARNDCAGDPCGHRPWRVIHAAWAFYFGGCLGDSIGCSDPRPQAAATNAAHDNCPEWYRASRRQSINDIKRAREWGREKIYK